MFLIFFKIEKCVSLVVVSRKNAKMSNFEASKGTKIQVEIL